MWSGPLVVELTDDPLLALRTAPGLEWSRLTQEAFPGTRLEVIDRQDGWLKVRLGASHAAWVQEDQVRLLPAGTPPPRARVRWISVQPENDATAIRIWLSEPVVAQVVADLIANTLNVRLFNARLAIEQIRYDSADSLIDQVVPVQTEEDVVDLRITLNAPLSGYRLSEAGSDLVLRVTRPLTPGLRGKIVVIDPGHGGSPGAVGPGGTPEASINLSIARRLGALLERAGAQVILTREADQPVHPSGGAADLYERVRIAEAARADLFVSIHANSASDEAGRQARGNEAYYYYPASRALARIVQEELTRAAGNRARFSAYRSLAVVRQTAMPAILVEVDFLSNPEVEQWLRQPATQERFARGLFNGIERYISEAAGPVPFQRRYVAAATGADWVWDGSGTAWSAALPRRWSVEGAVPLYESLLLWRLSESLGEGGEGFELDLAGVAGGARALDAPVPVRGFGAAVWEELRRTDGASRAAVRYRYQSEQEDAAGATRERHAVLAGLVGLHPTWRLAAFAGLVYDAEAGSAQPELLAEGAAFQPIGSRWAWLLRGEAGWTLSEPPRQELRVSLGLAWRY